MTNTHQQDLMREYANKIMADKHDKGDIYALADLVIGTTSEVNA